MITQQADFKFASFFYAIDFTKIPYYRYEEGERENNYRYSCHIIGVPSVWFKRKKGALTVSQGFLTHHTRNGALPKDASLEELIDNMKQNFDGRYGGRGDFIWNGTSMWAPGKSLAEMTQAQTVLDEYRNYFPRIPEGYTGWYSIN